MPFLNRSILGVAVLSLFPVGAGLAADHVPLPVETLNRATPVDFSTEIVPFLRKNCFACHNETKAKAGLILETPGAMLKGGDTGPAVEAGNGAGSLLFTTAAHREDPVMPPAKNKSNAVDLNPRELALLKLWIDQGAKGTVQLAPPAPKNWRRSEHEPIYTLALSPDGRFVACGRGHRVHVYDLVQQILVTGLDDPELGGSTHRDFVHSIAFGADGTLATGGYREVKFWRLPEVVPIGEIPSPGNVTATASSADGTWRAVGLADGSIRLFRIAEPDKPPVVVKDHTASVNALAFLPDHVTLVSGGADKSLRRRRVTDPPKSDRIDVPAGVVSLTSIEDGTRVAFGTEDNKIVLVGIAAFDPAPEPRPTELVDLAGSSAPPVLLRAVRIGDVEHLVSAGADGTIRIWNPVARNLVRQIAAGGAVVAFDVTADGSKVVVQRAGPGPARLFKLTDGGLLKDLEPDPTLTPRMATIQLDEQMATRVAGTYKAEVPKVEALLKKEREAADKAEKDLPKAKETLVAKQGEYDKKLTARDLAEDALTERSPGDPKLAEFQKAAETANVDLEKSKVELEGAKRAAAAAESSRELALKQADELARKLEDTKAGQTRFEAKAEDLKVKREALRQELATEVPKLEIAGVAFSRDGSQVMTALPDGTVRFYGSADGAYLETMVTRPGIVGLDVTADDQLMTRLKDGRSVTWATRRSWALTGRIGDGENPAIFPDRVTALAFSPDGTVLATGSGVPSRSGELKFWKSATPTAVAAANPEAHSDTITDIEFSPDGDQVVTGSADKFVKTFEAATGKPVRSFEAHTGHVLGVDWSDDGRRLASVSADQELRIWDPLTGDQVRTLKGWEKEITSVAFYSKTNEQVLTTCGDKKLRLDNGVVATTDDFQYCAAVSPDGKFFVAGGEDGVLRVWNAARQLVMTFHPSGAAPEPGMTAAGTR